MIDPVDNFHKLDTSRLPSPCYVLDLPKLEENLRLLADVSKQSGTKILLALKAFSCPQVADLVSSYLNGTATSGLYEAKLAKEYFSGEVHSFIPGIKPDQISEIEALSDHLIFNSLRSFLRHKERLEQKNSAAYGIRLNPQCSQVENSAYDPCAPGSRFGSLGEQIVSDWSKGLTGAHIHALCDQGFEAFENLVTASEDKFAELFQDLEWLNLGGGHLITAPDYDRKGLIKLLRSFKEKYDLDLYIEPGTAVALNAGALVTEVLDVGDNNGRFAIVDASATCHMPDVIEAPYTPEIMGATIVGENEADGLSYKIGGPTCMAGDIIGTYRFEKPLEVGDKLIILDQAYYTMVKTTTFNGTPLPSIALWHDHNEQPEVVKSFGYEDFVGRLI